MNGRTIEKMQYFVGRVCSVVTSSMNRAFDETISREHFVIRVGEISMDGLWGSHPYNDDMVSFFSMAHVISIHEEIELDPNKPEHAEMIKEYEDRTGHKAESDLKGSPPKENDLLPVVEKLSPLPDPDSGDMTFVDIHSIEKLAEQTNKTFVAKELLG